MMLPKGWEKLALGRKIKVQGGFAFKSEEFGQVGLPIVRISNIQGGKIQLEKAPRYREEKGLRRFYLNDGDILIAMSGATTGKIGTFESSENFPTAYLNQRVGRFVPVEKRSVDISFFHQIFRTARFQHLILIDALGGAQPNVSGKEIESLVFSIPPLPEQRRIAEILSTWDRAIETVEALIDNARAQKKALMQSLLTGKHRLPGFNGEWRSVCLGEIGKLRKGKGIQRDQVRATGLPCIRYGEIYTQHHEQVRHFNSFIDAETAADSVPISAGDILFTCSGETAEEIGKCVAYLGSERAYAGGDIIILSPATDNAAFLSYVLNDTGVTEQKRRFGQGNSVVHISAANLARLTFTLPDRAEQDAIANVLDDATGHIGGLEIELATLTQEKSALMQQLLTGKRRVRVEEASL